jgi:hypothetical protein
MDSVCIPAKSKWGCMKWSKLFFFPFPVVKIPGDRIYLNNWQHQNSIMQVKSTINFADKRRSLGRYSSLADSSRRERERERERERCCTILNCNTGVNKYSFFILQFHYMCLSPIILRVPSPRLQRHVVLFIFQKTERFITIAVRAFDPTYH